MKTKHTPLPYHVAGHCVNCAPQENGKRTVAMCFSAPDARFVTRACNSHDELLHHLSILAEEDSQCAHDWVQKKKAARAAIARAQEVAS